MTIYYLLVTSRNTTLVIAHPETMALITNLVIAQPGTMALIGNILDRIILTIVMSITAATPIIGLVAIASVMKMLEIRLVVIPLVMTVVDDQIRHRMLCEVLHLEPAALIKDQCHPPTLISTIKTEDQV